MKTRRAAMEMSVGTLVTIVLLMAVLGLGIFLIQKIFSGGTNAIDNINDKVVNEINQIFSDESSQTALYPGREVKIEKGKTGGVGFSLKNTDRTPGSFSYEVLVGGLDSTCTLTETQAQDLISLGGAGQNIELGSGDQLPQPRLIRFIIPESAPLCVIRYDIKIDKDGETYTSDYFDIEIVS